MLELHNMMLEISNIMLEITNLKTEQIRKWWTWKQNSITIGAHWEF